MGVKLTNYCGGANAALVTIGPVELYFSYATPVAFRDRRGRLVVRQNDWSNTTGRHLSAIDGGDKDARKQRVSGAEFERLLQDALEVGILLGGPLED